MALVTKRKLILPALCAGHFINDAYSSSIYPLLPLLQQKLNLTMSQVFWLAPLIAVSSSLMQPVYGFISDRYMRRFFAVYGPAITAVFISMIGLAPAYGVLIILLIGGGFGIGSFHPQGAAMAFRASGKKTRISLAIFVWMGSMGFAFGPTVSAWITGTFGLGKTYYTMVFGLLVSAVLYFVCPPLNRVPKHKVEHTSGAGALHRIKSGSLVLAIKPVWQPLLMLYMITVLRSGLQLTANNYLPFLLRGRGYEVQDYSHIMTLYLMLGGIGGLVGGFAAEHLSGRIVTLYSGLLAGPVMIAALYTEGAVSITLLGISGFILLSTLSANVAMAQELVPSQTSTISALMMGAAWGFASLEPPFLEHLVPKYGFRTPLLVSSALTMFSAVLAYMMPRDEKQQRHARMVEGHYPVCE